MLPSVCMRADLRVFRVHSDNNNNNNADADRDYNNARLFAPKNIAFKERERGISLFIQLRTYLTQFSKQSQDENVKRISPTNERLQTADRKRAFRPSHFSIYLICVSIGPARISATDFCTPMELSANIMKPFYGFSPLDCTVLAHRVKALATLIMWPAFSQLRPLKYVTPP